MKQIKANTTYNDMVGTIAFDFKKGTRHEFLDYAKERGIDIKCFEPIGFEVYCGENNFFYLSFFCIDLVIAEKYKQENNGRLPIVKIDVCESYKNFEKTFKQLNANLLLNTVDVNNLDYIKKIK